jgi:hypothetical protein
MPSPKAATLLAAAKIQDVANDVRAGRTVDSAEAVAQVAEAMAFVLRALASQWHS